VKPKQLKIKKMKALIFTITTLAILLGSKTDMNLNNRISNYLSSENLESSNSQIVKATHYEGELIPVVTLLSLDVFGFTDQEHRVKTTLVNGERIPMVTLPELEIVASK
jgi:hypothetical protein